MKKFNGKISLLLSFILALALFSGCVSVKTTGDNDNKSSVSSQTSTSVSTTVSTETSSDTSATVSDEGTTSTEVSVSTETSTSEPEKETEDENKSEDKERLIKTKKTYYNYGGEEGLRLVYDVEYDEFENFVRYYSIGDCDDSIPYTAVRTEDGDGYCYVYTYDTTGWSDETVEAYKAYNLEYRKTDAEGRATLDHYQNGGESVYVRNDRGDVTYSKTTSDWGTYEYYYSYDENGNILSSKTVSDDYSYENLYEYDENGNMVKSEYSSGDYGYKYLYTYNEDGNALTEEYINSDGSYGNLTTNEYDAYGKLVHSCIEDAISHKKSTEVFYDRDADGLIAKETRIYFDYENGEETERYIYDYSYDEKGRQIGYESARYINGEKDDESVYGSELQCDEHGNEIWYKYHSFYYNYECSYEYEYDEYGDIVVMLYYEEGVLYSRNEFTYFD